MGNEEVTNFPYEIPDHLTPIYTELKGWNTPMTAVQSESEFPAEFNAYIQFIEKYIGVQISIVSVGPDRSQTIRL